MENLDLSQLQLSLVPRLSWGRGKRAWEPLHAHASILPTKPGKRTGGGRLMFHLPSRKPRYEATPNLLYQVWMEDRTSAGLHHSAYQVLLVGLTHAHAVVPRLSFPRPQESLGTRLAPAVLRTPTKRIMHLSIVCPSIPLPG